MKEAVVRSRGHASCPLAKVRDRRAPEERMALLRIAIRSSGLLIESVRALLFP